FQPEHQEEKQASEMEWTECSAMEGKTVPAWRTALEIGFGLLPIVGQIMGGYELLTGREFWTDRELSETDRAVLAGFLLVPTAGKIYKGAKTTITARSLRETYTFLSEAESKALYRATEAVKPGSEAAQILDHASLDISAGRGIKDPDRLKKIDRILGDMG